MAETPDFPREAARMTGIVIYIVTLLAARGMSPISILLQILLTTCSGDRHIDWHSHMCARINFLFPPPGAPVAQW